MSHSVRRHLRVDVEGYDQAIRQFIPAYDAMISRAAAEAAAGSPSLVVDLGAGSGALSAALLAHDRVGAVAALDVDPEMLDQARVRLAPFGERARFLQRSFFDDLPECQAVTASLSLHHIPSMEQKTELYRHLHAALPAGGRFVNADVVVASEGPIRDATYRAWADHLVRSGIAEAQAWQHFAEWADEDTYVPLDVELAALDAAGFEARCVWRDEPSTVVVAVRR